MASNVTTLITLDALLAVAAFFSAMAVRLGYFETGWNQLEPVKIYSTLIFTAVVLFSSHLMEVYDLSKNTRKREIIVNILFGTVTSFSLLSAVYYLVPDVIIGRGVLFFSLLFFVLYQFCVHALYLAGKDRARFSQRVLVLGTGVLAARIGEIIASDRRNFVLAGYAACGADMQESAQETAADTGVPQDMIVGTSDDLLDTVRQARADVIVVALTERRGVFPLRDVLRCKLNSIQVMDAPTLYELVQGKLMLESITPSWFIFSDGFRRTTVSHILKRTIDIALSVIGLLLTLPFMPLIALAIRIDSPGPVFFRQERVGNREKLFMLYKFRTMRQDAEAATGAVWAEKKDPRVTTLGRFFRGSRIDEIPQLINVLKGEMSFVGPRPERPEFVEKLKLVIPYYSKRHFIKPGLTGWAQVRYPYGASVEDAVEKLRYDLYYIKNLGPFLDTLIFFETIKVVLFGFGGR
ncbi:MAG: TIGR03013 family PEP-CTERM/XrtA system glycosyltransferase [Desulfuromonadaceae bacterium]|nr:TIGR03013 family PEP-CTERM/XrtA system glycosyltransferase [Desulfuromonadaceae bacterium]MDD5104846.1 TIGR03013 family PEP-CTERM/XrtA system glycosyltransferase [Desulfuromonadaceae bacterium]